MWRLGKSSEDELDVRSCIPKSVLTSSGSLRSATTRSTVSLHTSTLGRIHTTTNIARSVTSVLYQLAILKLEKTSMNLITTLVRVLYTNSAKWFEMITTAPATVDYTVLNNSSILRTSGVSGAK
jgi:hypothetical protein